MKWYVDKGLSVLNAQLRTKFPGIVIGTIGDPSHSARESEHNPEQDGSVDACDPMIGSAFTKRDGEWLFRTLHEHRDPRILYVIWNRQIFSSVVAPWTIREYTRDDPHTGHLHVSVNDLHEDDGSQWNLGGKRHMLGSLQGYGIAILKYGMNDRDFDGYNMIGRAQCLLNFQGAALDVDGDYGAATKAAVSKYLGGDGKTINAVMWTKLAGLNRM